MEFTQKQREYIDKELKIADEWQKKSGNKTYSMEEVFDNILMNIKKGEEYRI